MNEEIARHNSAVMYRYRMRTGARMMNLSGVEEELKDSLRKPVEEPALFYKQMVEAGILGVIQSSPVPITALWDKETVFGENSSLTIYLPLPISNWTNTNTNTSINWSMSAVP